MQGVNHVQGPAQEHWTVLQEHRDVVAHDMERTAQAWYTTYTTSHVEVAVTCSSEYLRSGDSAGTLKECTNTMLSQRRVLEESSSNNEYIVLRINNTFRFTAHLNPNSLFSLTHTKFSILIHCQFPQF